MTSSPDTITVWRSLVSPRLCPNQETYDRCLTRLSEGRLTREENPLSHFCTYFLPVNTKTKQVFIVHHKKSNLWLAPGGHLDLGETPDQAVNREIQEELGVPHFFKETPTPFLFSIVDIDRKEQSCKCHNDLWYAMETDGSDFAIDPSEFYETRWVTIPEARLLVTDPSNLVALERVKTLMM